MIVRYQTAKRGFVPFQPTSIGGGSGNNRVFCDLPFCMKETPAMMPPFSRLLTLAIALWATAAQAQAAHPPPAGWRIPH
jgi:hypothetical protein